MSENIKVSEVSDILRHQLEGIDTRVQCSMRRAIREGLVSSLTELGRTLIISLPFSS